MNVGRLIAHCSACIPPIDAPTTACSRSMPRCSTSRRCWAAIMSRSAKRGKRMPGCAAELDGDVDRPLPIGSAATMHQRAGSSARPGPIRKSSRWCVAVRAGQTRSGVRACAIELAMDDNDCRKSAIVSPDSSCRSPSANVRCGASMWPGASGGWLIGHLLEDGRTRRRAGCRGLARSREAVVDLVERDARVISSSSSAGRRGTARRSTGSRASASRRRSSSARSASRPSASPSGTRPRRSTLILPSQTTSPAGPHRLDARRNAASWPAASKT